MTAVDWLIVFFVALMALSGYRRGLVVGVLSFVGFFVGALIGTRIGPHLLPGGSHSRYAPVFGLVGALVAGLILSSGLGGIGRRARALVPIPGIRLIDGLLGAVFAACAGFGVAWLLGAIALQASGSRVLRADIQRSKILQELNALLPPSGPILNALSRIDPLPSVAGPPADVPAPTRGVLASRGVTEAAPSVVKIVGTACGLGIEGSGWVAAPGLVVTNAHVIAGETDTTVQLRGVGNTLDAHPVEFDPINDIAVLRVPGLSAPTLKLARRALVGTAVGILGFPLDGAYDRQPGRLGTTQVTLTEDAYGNGHFERDISAVRGLIRPGNSGGPLVDRGGRVLGTVFAAITNAAPGQSGGFAVPNRVVSRDLAKAFSRSGTVGSGACVS